MNNPKNNVQIGSDTKVNELRRGWVLLLGSMLGCAIGNAGLPFYTNGVFVKHLESTFGWTRTELSDVAFAAILTVVVSATFVGGIIDRYGVRRPLIIAFAAVAGAFFAMSSLQGSFVVYVVIQLLGAALGLASTPLTFTRAINENFSKARGLALGLTIAGTGLAAMIAPPLITAFIQDHGWRAGYRALAIAVIIGAPIVIALLSFKASGPVTHVGNRNLPSMEISLLKALRDPIFIRLLLVFIMLAIAVCGYVFHLIPMLTDTGMSATRAAMLQSLLGFAVIIGRVAVGFCIDRFFAPRVAAIAVSITAVGMVALALNGGIFAIPAVFMIGFALGAEVDLIGYLTARYFGLASYGRLYGFLYGAFVLGTGLSPMLISRLQEVTGNYQLPLLVCAAFAAAAAALFISAPAFPITQNSVDHH